jgi:hypothetical protein
VDEDRRASSLNIVRVEAVDGEVVGDDGVAGVVLGGQDGGEASLAGFDMVAGALSGTSCCLTTEVDMVDVGGAGVGACRAVRVLRVVL